MEQRAEAESEGSKKEADRRDDRLYKDLKKK